MIVTCPSCETRYALKPESLSPRGRAVRCAKCGHTWTQPPPVDLPKVVEPPPIPPTPAPSAVAPGTRTRPGIALALLGLILVGAVAGALLGRDRVVANWPMAKALYQAAGVSLSAPLDGLEIVANMTKLSDGAVTVMLVTGDIYNTTDRSKAVPLLHGVIRDAAKQEIARWTFQPAGDRISPGGSVPFSDRYENPPEGAVDIVVVLDGAE